MPMNSLEKNRQELIEFWKTIWIMELEDGYNPLYIDIELGYLESIEDYEQCEGIKQALFEYVDIINEKQDKNEYNEGFDKEV